MAEAGQTRDAVAAALRSLGVSGDLSLTGATSVAEALTKGDIDLHLRVAQGAFSDVVALLIDAYPVGSCHSWAPTLAVFDVPGPRATGLAVTPMHSEHDERFRRTWRALRTNPELLAQYNALKSATMGTSDYEQQKSDFFSSISQPK